MGQACSIHSDDEPAPTAAAKAAPAATSINSEKGSASPPTMEQLGQAEDRCFCRLEHRGWPCSKGGAWGVCSCALRVAPRLNGPSWKPHKPKDFLKWRQTASIICWSEVQKNYKQYLYKQIKINKNIKCLFSLNFQNIIRRSPQASPTKNWKIKSAVKEKIRDLSSSSKRIGSHKKQRGAGRFSAPPPLFFERPKIVQTGA